MEKALEILIKIEDCSKKALDTIINENFESLPPVLECRSNLIALLAKAQSADLETEKAVLHRIEKLESKMLEILKNNTNETKDSINTVTKGKKAIKNGYFKSKMGYEKNNRFSKRG